MHRLRNDLGAVSVQVSQQEDEVMEFNQFTADDLQVAAEATCRRIHGGQCIAWGQAVVLFNHGTSAVAVLSTVGPIIDRYAIPGVSQEWS